MCELEKKITTGESTVTERPCVRREAAIIKITATKKRHPVLRWNNKYS